MNQKTRHERALSSLRRSVRKVYEQNGYKILTWLEGACPDKTEKIRDDAPADYIVLDLAIDALARANGKEPNKDPDKRPYRRKKNSKRPVPSPRCISRLIPRGK